jgi:type I restriction enzyme R subunit
MKEQKIENDLINKLSDLKYTYRADIKDRATLEKNFREKFESLNQVKLTDKEFERLCEEIITPDTFNAAKILRGINTFKREDETPLNYTLVNIKDWCKNTFEVINQLRMNTDYSHHIYDVVLLINGIPVVQIELKTLGINPRRAMQQIVEYKNDAGNGYNKTLMCFLQLFVVSNQTNTWYFANNNSRHFAFDANERFLPLYQYADKNNRPINHLDEFAETFLAKCTLGQMISRYMVLVASEKKLLMMRPYQIYAVKAIVDCIKQGTGNGYIWHTTGSGKTLTSFKASTLLKDNPDIEKCLFVVDRKDLDRQTREEFNRFQEGCVEENTNTATLVKRLASTDYADKVIVTTIQKLGLALDENSKKNYKSQLQPLKNKRIVFIFDECHRSQFGDNHQAIKEFFPKAQLFGFTGTPIFEKNASYRKIEGQEACLVQTDDVFQQCLHAYTITHAIEDRNVLRFHVDYYKPEGKEVPKKGESLAKRAIVEAILAKHDTATGKRKFNALFSTGSIDDAIEYYQLFKQLQENKTLIDPDFKPLHIACVFTPPVLPSNNEQEDKNNKDVKQLQEDLEQEREDNKKNPEEKKKALTSMLADYNVQYGTNHSINEFDLYYQDVQKRIKDQQYPNHDYPHSQKLDIVIVVEMLLTGFDSKFLNTLYVDKNMTYHKLIQAFSRTNRVLNDTKPYGNILDFRQQQGEVDKAIALFSGKEQEAQAREIWLVDPAPKVVEKLDDAIKRLDDFMQSQGLNSRPEDVPNLKGDAARATFIERFKEVQRLKTQLDQYTDLTPELKETIETLLPKDQLQGFKGVYLETAQRLREKQHKYDESVIPEVNELDFEFVLFASEVIDYDYIMKLIARYSQETPSKQSMSRKELIGLIQADAKFLDEREEIEAYINSLQEGVGLNEKAIKEGYERFKAEKYNRAFNAIAANYSLDATALTAFVAEILRLKRFDDEALTNLLKPLGLGWKERTAKKLALMEELIPLLHKQAKGRSIAGLDVYEQ